MAIKAHIQELANGIKKDITFDSATHIFTEENSFEKHLPDGIDMPTVGIVNQYNTDFVAASALAVGEYAIEEMKKHKTIETISADFKMGEKDTVSHMVTRQKTFTNPTNPSEPVQKYGAVSSVYSAHAGKSEGQLKQVKAFLYEIAAESLNRRKA
jgi:hypothetical protein